MFILSQNKMNLVNVKNISSIWTNDNENCSYVYIDGFSKDYECIGIYKSKDKAKKVFKYIQDWISAFIDKKYVNGNIPNIYEMPQDDEVK